MRNTRTQKMVQLALLMAIEIVLFVTPLGFIAVGPIRSTTLHIPVIFAGIILGYKGGAFLGLLFGILSVCINTFAPTALSFAFSPFYSLGGIDGNFFSLIIAIGPRVLLGVISAFVYQMFKKIKKDKLGVLLATISSTFMHTIMVMTLIYVFFKDQYEAVKSLVIDSLFTFLGAIMATNGIMEIIVAVLIVSPLYLAHSKVKGIK